MKPHSKLVKRFLATLLISILVLVFPNSPRADSIDDGLQAYGAGDYKKALEILKPLAEHGNAEAQFQLGYMHSFTGLLHDGEDDKEALKWLRKAAEQGHVKAQFYFGEIYDSNASVLKLIFKNNMTAAKWYRKAAEQGHALAQLYSGHMYYDGRGIPQDYMKAARWYSGQQSKEIPLLNSVWGSCMTRVRECRRIMFRLINGSIYPPHGIGVRNRDITEKKMTPPQVAEAQRLAREWKPKLSQYTLSFRRSR